jgi:hypothetical protein
LIWLKQGQTRQAAELDPFGVDGHLDAVTRLTAAGAPPPSRTKPAQRGVDHARSASSARQSSSTP